MVQGLTEPGNSSAIDTTSPLAIVSADSHIGPRLVEDLRAYCPRRYLERFDAFAAMHTGLVQPERHVGCAQLPTWDIEATLKEIEWAREAGLRSVNWPAPRLGTLEYDEPDWEPVWSACEALEIPLTTHAGAVVPGMFRTDPQLLQHRWALIHLEAGGWPSRRGMLRMVLSGVFQRHPKLKLVLTEVAGGWWPYTIREMDPTYRDNNHALHQILPEAPSDYCRSNVFIGASFIAPFEVEEAIRENYSQNVLWGQDYPHPEGVWSYREDGVSVTRLHLRNSFCNAAPDEARRMLSENAMSVYGLDREALQNVAERISTMSLAEIGVPIEAEPDSYTKGFRKIGPWA